MLNRSNSMYIISNISVKKLSFLFLPPHESADLLHIYLYIDFYLLTACDVQNLGELSEVSGDFF